MDSRPNAQSGTNSQQPNKTVSELEKQQNLHRKYFYIAVISIATIALAIFFGRAIYKGTFSTVKDEVNKNIPDIIKKKFGDWKTKNNKSYATPEEEEKRLEIYFENSKLIEANNLKEDSPLVMGDN